MTCNAGAAGVLPSLPECQVLMGNREENPVLVLGHAICPARLTHA